MLGPGTKIDRYELVSLLGEGGMAQVWAARQEGKHGFKKLFALKAIHHRLADDPQFHKMFLDEARIASEIEHPNVAQVFDLGEQGNMLYLVMEYVDGESLAALLGGIARKSGTLSTVPTAHALRIVADVCAGLNAAHKLVGSNGSLRGVVHRDVSPQNVLLSVKGDVKLIDFGIAHAADRVAENTGVDALKGKLRYMAPEQARREPIGPFTDVWAAGALLYRMLSGRPPYEAPSELDTMKLLLSGAAPAPLPEDIPALVAAIVDRAMSADPGDRYASAAEMHTALEAAIGEEGFVPDVATWVRTNLTDRYRARRDALAAREEQPAFSFQISAEKTLPSAIAPELPFAATSLGSKEDIPSLVVPERPPPAAPPPSSRGEAIHITLQSQPNVRAEELGKPATPIEVKITRSTSIGKDDKEEPEPRSFMDVRAIQEERVAQAQAAADKQAKGEGEEPKAEPKPTKSPAQAKREAEEVLETKRKKRLVAAGAIGVLLLLVVILLVALPAIVRSRVLAGAAAAGVDLTIGDVSAGLSGADLHNVTARSRALPGVEVAITEVRWAGLFSANEVRVIGVDLKIQGDLDGATKRLQSFYDAQQRQLIPSGKGSRRVTVANVHLLWTDPFGAGSRIDAGDVGAEVEAAAAGAEEIRGSAGRFEITTPKTVLGPWSASVESSPKSTRARLLFDPLLPDGPNAVYLWGPGTKPHLTVKIPRTTFAQIGLRPQELGLPVEPSSDVEVRLDGGPNPNNRIDGSAKIEVHGVHVPWWKQPVDIKLEGAAAGMPGHPLDLERTVVNVGPFAAFLNGTVTPHERGLRLDATWRTQPISCERLAKAEAKSLGTFAASLQEIAHSTGALRVTGSAYATGTVKVDSAAPEAAAVTFLTRETCGVSLFGQ